ncbi:MAG: type transport system permease protein [Thermococcaceae archaeon]|nr:type transport system permease protein [Thermococcaceae archaeon]
MILAISEKEFKDYLTSRRFLILFGFLLAVVVLSLIQVNLQMQSWNVDSSEAPKVYDVLQGLNFYLTAAGAIFAISLGFDAVTKEREGKTLNVLMGHPVFRDQIILGKMLGGAITIAVAVLITGLIMIGTLLGIGITIESYPRLLTYFLTLYLYLMVFFTMGVAFSAHAKSSGNALMYALVVYLALTVLLMPVSGILAHYVVGPQPEKPPELKEMEERMRAIYESSNGNLTDEQIQELMELSEKMSAISDEYYNKTHEWMREYWGFIEKIQVVSPEQDFRTISNYVLNPHIKKENPFDYEVYTPEYGTFEPPEYSLSESLSFVRNEFIALFAYLVLWFVVAYLGFVRAEIR